MIFSSKFIKANDAICDFNNHVPAPYMRREFDLPFSPEKAEITICGLGFYELYINGKNITKGPLAPYISNPNDILYYDNYDLAPYLNVGKNVIGILLGNGFRNPFGGFVWNFHIAACRGPVAVAFALEASKGEETLLIEADETVKTHPSPITFNEIRMGCRYDARLEIPNWAERDFDDKNWESAMPAQMPAGVQKLCKADPIVITDRLSPVSITHYDELPFAHENKRKGAKPLERTVRKNVYVYDFGVNGAGVTVLKINGKPGQTITIRHAEFLQEGKFSVNTTIFDAPKTIDRYLEYGQVDVFVCKGGEETFVPKFKYDGFRYAYVEGLLPEQATTDALTYLVMNSDLEARGDFTCSDESLNRLFTMTRRSVLSNFYYFPTDCPHREKNGWTGDAAMSAEHILLNLRASKSLKEWLANVRASQREDGALPGIVPTGGWGFDWGNGPAWDLVSVYLPYYIYLFDGDTEVIRENASMILRYLQYTQTKQDENGLVAYGLGDWIDPFKKITKKIASPLIFTDSAVIFEYAQKAAFLFDVIGMKHEAAYARAVAADMRNAIRTHQIDFDTMTVIGDCQTSQALALAYGLFDDAEIPAAQKRLVEIIHRDGDVNACGMLGLRYVYHVLSQMGETDLAVKVITSPSRSCYGSWLTPEATTLLENFPFEDGTDTCSQNHHFLGDIAGWMISELGGIKINPTALDHTSFEIAPQFASTITHARATYLSEAREKLETEWTREGDKITLTVSVPTDMHGTLNLDGYTSDKPLPDALSAGIYTFVLSKK